MRRFGPDCFSDRITAATACPSFKTSDLSLLRPREMSGTF
jgi:hypothetical protein